MVQKGISSDPETESTSKWKYAVGSQSRRDNSGFEMGKIAVKRSFDWWIGMLRGCKVSHGEESSLSGCHKPQRNPEKFRISTPGVPAKMAHFSI